MGGIVLWFRLFSLRIKFYFIRKRIKRQSEKSWRSIRTFGEIQ